ncbi:MAG: hypothetical protein HQL57_07425 [Magnetococcales bacterium]|nr:hypothetical protein [Magnetococcales bacterium]
MERFKNIDPCFPEWFRIGADEERRHRHRMDERSVEIEEKRVALEERRVIVAERTFLEGQQAENRGQLLGWSLAMVAMGALFFAIHKGDTVTAGIIAGTTIGALLTAFLRGRSVNRSGNDDKAGPLRNDHEEEPVSKGGEAG